MFFCPKGSLLPPYRAHVYYNPYAEAKDCSNSFSMINHRRFLLAVFSLYGSIYPHTVDNQTSVRGAQVTLSTAQIEFGAY